MATSPASPAQWRILIVDDHPLLRRGLSALINGEPDLVVCAEAATHQTGLEAVVAFRPCLVIADLSLGTDDGLALVRAIRSRHAELPILVLTVHDASRSLRSAMEAGANGFANKGESGETLLSAIRGLMGGES